MITVCIPNIGTDDKIFLMTQKQVRHGRVAVLVVDRNQKAVGRFTPDGEWHEVSPQALTASLFDRLMDNVTSCFCDSRRDVRSKVATIGLLVRYETQLQVAA